MSTSPDAARFRDRSVVLANGSEGRTIAVASANPVNYHEAISRTGQMARVEIDGKLFLPKETKRFSKKGKLACVMIVPGSLGIAASHLRHAETLNGLGLATFVLDPFGPRGVTSTVANQTQYSFAASAWDVLAAVKALAALPGIDPARIGAQGHSRGGAAVLSAATRRLAQAALGKGPFLRAVLGAYPYSGHQFLDPSVGDTAVRSIIGDKDEWCLPQQVQAHMQAIRLAGGEASFRLVAGAAHSFDRGTPMERVANASVQPSAPTYYIADDGAFVHPITGEADARLVDRDMAVYALKAGYGVTGASIGSRPGDAELFETDMIAFWSRVMA
jgi:dienelactone hydrolase